MSRPQRQAELAGGSGSTFRRIGETLRPDPRMTVAEWADAHRILPPVGSAKPGPWRTSRVPYMRAVMEACSPSAPYELVAVQASAQCGKSEVLLNIVGYTMDQAPAPILAIQPTVDLAERFSRQRIAPMIDATPRLKRVVASNRSRDSGNTLLSKEFINGILVLAGANSGAGLRSMPAKIVLADEVDAYPGDVDGEGDPIELARARTETYVQSKMILTSTPKTKGLSRIELAVAQCDRQAEFRVPCPHCKHAQALVFEQLRWPEGEPELATYECVACGEQIEHRHKPWMVRAGAWVLIRDEGTRSIGFTINQLVSTLGKTTWGGIAEKYEQAKGKPALLRTFYNTILGLPFAEASEAPAWRSLYDRRETYPIGVVPPGVRFLTAGVDVQKDRLECQLIGWGRGKESWSVDYRILPGDTARPDVWALLDAVLAEDIPCAGGGTLPIRLLCVDSGYATQSVYSWVRRYPQAAWGPAGVAARAPRTVTATKGVEDWRAVLLPPAKVDTSSSRKGLKVARIGTSLVKRELYDWLRLEGPTDAERQDGLTFPPGFVHFPEYGEDWFKQLTAERLVTTATKQGFRRERWEKDPGARNEVLDTWILARAAAAIVGLDRASEKDWQRLEAVVPAGLMPDPATELARRSEPPTPASPAAFEAADPLGRVPPEPLLTPRPGGKKRTGVIRSSWVGRFRG